MTPPPLRTALAIGIRGAFREPWLLPVGALVAFLRSVATVPALVAAAGLLLAGAERAARLHRGSPLAAVEGGLAVLGSARFLALVAGVWLAGTVLAGLLRVLFLAGALPTLAARMAGVDATRRFAPGVAWGFARQLATWLLSALADLGAALYLVAVVAAAVRLVGGSARGAPALLLAGLGALALALGVAGILVARVLGDVAAARTAILGEGPADAFAGALRRALRRPGAFLMGGLAVAFAGVAAAGALQPAAGIVAIVGSRFDAAVALGPQLMLALIAALVAAAVDLAWLATAAALACARAAEP